MLFLLKGPGILKRDLFMFYSPLQIWVMAVSVCLVFTVTIGVFPVVTVAVESTIAGQTIWGKRNGSVASGMDQDSWHLNSEKYGSLVSKFEQREHLVYMSLNSSL